MAAADRNEITLKLLFVIISWSCLRITITCKQTLIVQESISCMSQQNTPA